MGEIWKNGGYGAAMSRSTTTNSWRNECEIRSKRMSGGEELLLATLVKRVLNKLEIDPPTLDLSGLGSLYYAWCRKVPFDNSLKMIDVRSATQGPLAGSKPDVFFENWLRFGSGGTCWSGNGGLYALLRALGFDASRGVATMLVAPDLPPNHGTVVVRIQNSRYLVDASILHSEPLLLDEANPPDTRVHSQAWEVQLRLEDKHFKINWHPLHMTEGLDCRIDYTPATLEDFEQHYESTRAWSPFNYELNLRLIKGDSVIGIAQGKRIEIDAQGRIHATQLNAADRLSVLVDELGIHKGLAERIPADSPTPPPPGSQTALRRLSQKSS
jgi:N-hydroxyarylamine O-acetyltransferase